MRVAIMGYSICRKGKIHSSDVNLGMICVLEIQKRFELPWMILIMAMNYVLS
jgi:hypothetical protein